MIEKPPQSQVTTDILQIISNPQYSELIKNVNNQYLYWDKVKYKVVDGITSEQLWAAVKFSRQENKIHIGDYIFLLKETDFVKSCLHKFDTTFRGLVNEDNSYIRFSSLMEEAIASSQMEGASTTRKVAKEMLKRKASPKDKSQQMIFNNYNTIQFLREHKTDKLNEKLILQVHKMISEKTLSDSSFEGQFRNDDNIVVMNELTGEIAHQPPTYNKITIYIQEICNFVNNDSVFIHPILKAIILHFMISFVHPFVDGNGRTARSLFYWYLLKKGYSLTEYLAISRIIYKSKGRYEKAFLYTEIDDYDLGYFIQYNLNVMLKAYEEFQKYIDTKQKEEYDSLKYIESMNLNARQAKIIQILQQSSQRVLICKELQIELSVSVKTIRRDLESLVEKGILDKVQLNKRLIGYIKK